jgi:hypothetical protein
MINSTCLVNASVEQGIGRRLGEQSEAQRHADIETHADETNRRRDATSMKTCSKGMVGREELNVLKRIKEILTKFRV